MISNKKTEELISETAGYMQKALNALEEYLEDVELNATKVGFEVGKLHKDFQLLSTLLDIKFPE